MPVQLFLDSTPLLSDGPALRARAAQEGHLFFRGLLPRTDLMEVRRDMLDVVRSFGWLLKGQDELGGQMDLESLGRVPEAEMRTDIGVSQVAYHAVQRLESAHRLPHHPRLLELFGTLIGDEVLVHPRHIFRMITGHASVFPTPPHQDFPLIQGTVNTWTCWFPVGDCPRPLGGLTVLRGSHRNGYLPIMLSKGAGGIAVPLCGGETDWVEGDFAAGDVLVFPCFTIHKALKCQWKDQIRLSFDVRYQSAREEVEPKSLLPHCELTWEEIYANWCRGDLRYYWEKQRPELSIWNPDLLQPSRRIC